MSHGERIGLLGGTFDPPHIGHLVAATTVRYELALTKVQLVVANSPWQKLGARAITPAPDRLAMVRAAVAGVDGLEASDVEIQRGGLTYTADTLRTVGDAHPGAELFLIVGSDLSKELPGWERHELVAQMATIVVVDRPGASGDRPPPGWRWISVTSPLLDVSSTDLRDRLATGRPVNYLIPRPILDVIDERDLYGVAVR